jgi:hypothetical protein
MSCCDEPASVQSCNCPQHATPTRWPACIRLHVGISQSGHGESWWPALLLGDSHSASPRSSGQRGGRGLPLRPVLGALGKPFMRLERHRARHRDQRCCAQAGCHRFGEVTRIPPYEAAIPAQTGGHGRHDSFRVSRKPLPDVPTGPNMRSWATTSPRQVKATHCDERYSMSTDGVLECASASSCVLNAGGGDDALRPSRNIPPSLKLTGEPCQRCRSLHSQPCHSGHLGAATLHPWEGTRLSTRSCQPGGVESTEQRGEGVFGCLV